MSPVEFLKLPLCIDQSASRFVAGARLWTPQWGVGRDLQVSVGHQVGPEALLVAMGCCFVFWIFNLRRSVRSQALCQSSGSELAVAFFIHKSWIQGVIPATLLDGSPSKWVGTVPSPNLLLVGVGPVTHGVGVLSKTFWEICLRIFPRAWRCQDISNSPVCLRSPPSLLVTGDGLPYRISKGD